MNNILIWGFYWDDNNKFNNQFWGHINYHRLSIKSALSLGYECHIYLQESNVKYFSDINVKIKLVHGLDTTLFDWIKYYILSNDTTGGTLIDGDLILNSKLPNIKSDIVFEKYETNAWKLLYEEYVGVLNKLNIRDIIPEWSGNPRKKIINIGILKIQNKQFKDIYLNRWNNMNEFIKNNSKIVNKKEFTGTATQYLLTELVDYYEINIENYLNNKNSNYSHYMGHNKFKNGIVPYDKLLLFNNKII
jgi:hypothetical protein